MRVDVGRVRAERKPDAATARVRAELPQQLARARRAVALKDVVERIRATPVVSIDSRSATLSVAMFLIGRVRLQPDLI